MAKRAYKTYKLPMYIDGVPIPVHVYHELRDNWRASVGRKRISVRVPLPFSKKDVQKIIDDYQPKVADFFQKNPTAKENYLGKGYKTGDILTVGARKYLLEINLEDRNDHNAKRHGSLLVLNLAEKDTEHSRQKAIKHLLSRAVASHFLPDIHRRVMELNRLHFQRPIKKVYLKYNRSNWGSCSTNGNVNLSTRLLFAPDEVIDYVIIHELSHLLEMNHSPAFWAHVNKAMPDYKSKEKWLKEHGKSCDF